jgi:hypothetical protein
MLRHGISLGREDRSLSRLGRLAPVEWHLAPLGRARHCWQRRHVVTVGLQKQHRLKA